MPKKPYQKPAVVPPLPSGLYWGLMQAAADPVSPELLGPPVVWKTEDELREIYGQPRRRKGARG